VSLTLISPPTIRELLSDPVMKKVILKTPRLPRGCVTTQPFRVVGIRTDDKWAMKNCDDYAAAFAVVKTMLKQPDKYTDAVITCRPTSFGPPPGLVMPPRMEWCGHCRRPSVFRRLSPSHPVLKRWSVVSDDDVRRCYYCAARLQRFWHW
jgi:hypothetical protein